MTPERLKSLRARLEAPDYIDAAIDVIAEDIADGRKALIPVSDLQREQIENRDRKIEAMKKGGMAPRHIAENLGLTMGQTLFALQRIRLKKKKEK